MRSEATKCLLARPMHGLSQLRPALPSQPRQPFALTLPEHACLIEPLGCWRATPQSNATPRTEKTTSICPTGRGEETFFPLLFFFCRPTLVDVLAARLGSRKTALFVKKKNTTFLPTSIYMYDMYPVLPSLVASRACCRSGHTHPSSIAGRGSKGTVRTSSTLLAPGFSRSKYSHLRPHQQQYNSTPDRSAVVS